MQMRGPLFDAVNESQDGWPLSKYLRRRAETMIGEYDLPVGECINETICQSFATAQDGDELLCHLRYAARELASAAAAVESALLEMETNGGK
jgi:hypothetical protein